MERNCVCKHIPKNFSSSCFAGALKVSYRQGLVGSPSSRPAVTLQGSTARSLQDTSQGIAPCLYSPSSYFRRSTCSASVRYSEEHQVPFSLNFRSGTIRSDILVEGFIFCTEVHKVQVRKIQAIARSLRIEPNC